MTLVNYNDNIIAAIILIFVKIRRKDNFPFFLLKYLIRLGLVCPPEMQLFRLRSIHSPIRNGPIIYF